MSVALSQASASWAQPPTSEGSWESTGYRSGRTRALWTQGSLGLAIGVITVSAVAIMGGLGLIDRAATGTATEAEFVSFAQLTEDLGNLTTILQVVTAICVLAWLHRAVANTPALGRGIPRWSPWQSVIWWFIPVAFLFMPFVVVRDLWRRMSPEGARASTAAVGAWWLLYLGGSLGSRVATAAMNTATTIEDVRSLFMAVIGLLSATAASGALLIWIVRTVESRQAALAATGFSHAPEAPAGPGWGAPVPASTPAAFCPRCASSRLPEARYCAGCAFDFGKLDPAR